MRFINYYIVQMVSSPQMLRIFKRKGVLSLWIFPFQKSFVLFPSTITNPFLQSFLMNFSEHNLSNWEITIMSASWTPYQIFFAFGMVSPPDWCSHTRILRVFALFFLLTQRERLKFRYIRNRVALFNHFLCSN